MMETTARTRITGAAQREASGKIGRTRVIMPKVPILSRMPMSSTEVPGVACSAVSGSQVWTGTRGALMAKAMKKVRKIQCPADVETCRLATIESMRKLGGAVLHGVQVDRDDADEHDEPPAREYRRNFRAAR